MSKGDRLRMSSRRLDESMDSRRHDMLRHIDQKLKEYGTSHASSGQTLTLTRSDELLVRVKQIYSLPAPTRRDASSTYKFIASTNAQQTTERRWVHHVEDLAALGPEYGNDWVREGIEDCRTCRYRGGYRWLTCTRSQGVFAQIDTRNCSL